MKIRERLANFLVGDVVNQRVSLAVRALDDPRDRPANTTGRDRIPYDREEILRDALEAWRLNPLARRIVSLTSQYVAGAGLGVSSTHKPTHEFLQDWWNHRLNNLSIRAYELCDELTRSGELFIVVSSDAAGMSYLRAIPALEISEIQNAKNDIEQEISYTQKPRNVGDDAIVWNAYDPLSDDGQAVMLHYTINKPIGAQRGESDLAPLLRWLARYSSWLEDRVRLNRFRQIFVYVLHGKFQNEADRLARQAAVNANPPNPGSILVVNDLDGEVWEILSPKLESHAANEDGLTIKKMIAAGAGSPLHFLAEPESSTRTTAEAAGNPTFRHYDQRQQLFLWLLKDLATIAVKRGAAKNNSIQATAPLQTKGADISARDNAELANSAKIIVEAFTELRAHALIDDEEFLRLAYKFAGEIVDVPQLLKDGEKAGTWKQTTEDRRPKTGDMAQQAAPQQNNGQHLPQAVK